MCFYKEYKYGITYEYRWWNRKRGRHKIAETDIVCYKNMYRSSNGIWISTCMGFRYKEGNTYTEDSVPLKELDKNVCLEDGVFHSYVNDDRVYFTACCVKCVIPAGTPYWVDELGKEYASTAIKIIGEA